MTKVLYSLAGLGRLLKGDAYRGAKFFILLDGNTYEYCLPELVGGVEVLMDAEFIEVPVGEECKRIEIAKQVWEVLLLSGADRNSLIVNLGGGSVCDLGGFVAAGFKRGIHYINVPTTLIGMCDAAIGGKTAVDCELELEDGSRKLLKNQVGFFYQPDAVCIDRRFLSTLNAAQLTAGGFEVLKTLLLANPDGYRGLLKGDLSDIAADLIKESLRIKQFVVKADPQEKGIRKMLNLGHTFGHAIESYGYDTGHVLSHGFAVGAGLLCVMYLSTKKLGFDTTEAVGYRKFLDKVFESSGLELPQYTLKDTERLLAYMRHDKKNAGGGIRCVLLRDIGVPVIDVEISDLEVIDTFLHFGARRFL